MVLNAAAPPPAGTPSELRTVGNHVRAARIVKGLEQADLARLLGVTKSTVWNWENGRSSPPTHRCAKVIAFLGYDPFPAPATLAERLVAFRRVRGLTTRKAAALAGADPASWESWEREERAITPACRERIEAVLEGRSGPA